MPKISENGPPAKKDGEAIVLTEASIKEVVNKNNATEFLKVIWKSYYYVVDQLHQKPSKISIMSLLTNSEVHRQALMRVIEQAHVTRDITVNQFDGIVNNTTACSNLNFNNEELTE